MDLLDTGLNRSQAPAPARFRGDLTTGFLNAILVTLAPSLISLPPYEGTLVVYRCFAAVIGSPAVADFVSTVIVEVTDRSLSLTLAAVIALFSREYIEKPS